MPHSNLEKRREYLKLYMREHRQVLTPEQKIRRAKTAKEWVKNNADKLKIYQQNRWMKDKEKITIHRKKYAQENVELVREQKKRFYENNKEAINSAVKEYRSNNLGFVRANARKYTKTPAGRLQAYRASAKERGLDFSLSTDDFNGLLVANCHYCDKEKANGVDRKQNSVGYYSYNVVACCKTCNYMKGTNDYQDFINHIVSIVKNIS